jgi:putative FmdB family regulatory protein
MPIYEYVCQTCGEKTTAIRPIANRDSPLMTHDDNGKPECKGKLTRVEISMPGPVHPSAAGWRQR